MDISSLEKLLRTAKDLVGEVSATKAQAVRDSKGDPTIMEIHRRLEAIKSETDIAKRIKLIQEVEKLRDKII